MLCGSNSPQPGKLIMKPHLLSLFACGLFALQGVASASLPAIQAEMRTLQFANAIELADQAVAANADDADHALFLKATAQVQSKMFAEAVTTADQLMATFPKSEWRHKAVFLKAQALIEQKKFAEAAAIYQAESARILSPERKQALVGEILRFAEKLEAKPDPNVPDAPQPDFAKAYSLYTKALAIELPRDFRDSIFFRKARAIQQAGNPAQAIQDFQAYLTEYDRIKGRNAPVDKRYRQGMSQADFDERKSRVNKVVRATLGMQAAPYLIAGQGGRPQRFGLKLAANAIRIEES